MTLKINHYLGWCIDPVHIGTGDYVLGRVDNTIVREPASRIPKIPGTSLSGALRDCVRKTPNISQYENDLFGKIEGGAQQGRVRIYDAHIVLFPVRSNQGVVWVSTKDRIKSLTKTAIESDLKDKVVTIKGLEEVKNLDLGWLMLSSNHQNNITLNTKMPEFVSKIALVSDQIFTHLVNDHLEVRTSVAIDPTTGAAKDGALFTYEAIPRGAVLHFEIGYEKEEDKPHIETAMKLIKLLGVGGMVTRGFGRFEVSKSFSVKEEEVTNAKP
jgi:CRISPR-associated protein Cmr4